MAGWNKPSAANQPATKKGGVKAPSLMKGVIVGAVAVVVGIVCIFVFSNGEADSRPLQKGRSSGRIKEVTPAPAPTNRVEEAEKGVRYTKNGKKIVVPKNPWGTPIPKDLEYKPHWEYTTEDYARIDPGYAERHERFLEKQKNKIWKTSVDGRLANVLFSEPGKPSMVIPFRKGFEEQFIKSIATPIIVSKDDPPEVQEQKKQMIETKIWLKDQMDAGKDIVEILNNEVKAQQELRGLHDNLVRELHQLEKTAASPEEIELYVEAANKMLAEKGAGKVGFSTKGSKIKIVHRIQREQMK